MTQKSCAVGMRNAILRNYLNHAGFSILQKTFLVVVYLLKSGITLEIFLLSPVCIMKAIAGYKVSLNFDAHI